MQKRHNFGYSTIFKVTVVFVLILIGAVTFMGGFVFWSTVGFMDRQTNTVIETDIEGLAEVYQRDGLRGLISTIESRVERDPTRSSIYLVADARREPVVGNISAWPNVAPNQSGWIEFSLTDRSTDQKTRARTRPFLLQGKVNLLVGRDIRNLQETKNLIERSLIWAMGIATIVGISAGLLFSRRVGQRLENISRTSREVMQGNLARRVPILGRGDDLDEVGQSFNAMLDEIQQLLSGIEHVTNNIAHDLRTPLSRLRNRLAQLCDTTAERGQSTASIEACIVEVDQLLAIFSALLRIAELEAAGPGRNLNIVDLEEVVRSAIELYEPLADDRKIVIHLESTRITVRGERELLLQAVCNLLDNAIKFSPDTGHIDIQLSGDKTSVVLSISDQGVGVDCEDTDRIFARFYRGVEARETDGSGLGLSMVSAICAHHGAVISMHQNAPGLRVEMEFPGTMPDAFRFA
ncbi:MAG: HAMP domain-containing sensor histidine kinase [Gammaproteobacteria bacterium]